MKEQDKNHRIKILESRHRQLDGDIKRGYSSYIDDASLTKMKHEKLHIKDQIEKLKNEA